MKVKAFLTAILLFGMILSCSQDNMIIESTCYQCYVWTTMIRCDTTETSVTVEPLKCDWTPEEIAQYERKTTYELNEKCFYLIQSCECYKTNER